MGRWRAGRIRSWWNGSGWPRPRPRGDRAGARPGGPDRQPRAAAQRAAERRLPAGARRGLLPRAPAAPGLSLRWVVNGVEFGRPIRSLRDTLLRRVPTSWAVPGGSADGEDRLGA